MPSGHIHVINIHTHIAMMTSQTKAIIYTHVPISLCITHGLSKIELYSLYITHRINIKSVKSSKFGILKVSHSTLSHKHLGIEYCIA